MRTFDQDLYELVEIKIKGRTDSDFSNGMSFDEMVSHFNEKYGSDMKNIMFEIYDEFCPDDEIKPIGEYLANTYIKEAGDYDVPLSEGVVVHLDDFSFNEGRLVLLPNPARIVLQNPETFHREVLWQAA